MFVKNSSLVQTFDPLSTWLKNDFEEAAAHKDDEWMKDAATGKFPVVNINLSLDKGIREIYNAKRESQIPNQSSSSSAGGKSPTFARSNMRRTSVVSMGTKTREKKSVSFPSRTRANTWTEKNETPVIYNLSNTKTADFPGTSLKAIPGRRIKAIIPEEENVIYLQQSNGVESKVSDESVKDVVSETLSKHLDGMTYEHKFCKIKSVELSKDIHDEVKRLAKDSYKFAVSVFIGEIRHDGIEVSSQCIWDPIADCVVVGYFKNDTVFAIASVFAILLD